MKKSLKIFLVAGVLLAFAVSLVALNKAYSSEAVKMGSSDAPFTSFNSFTNTVVGTTAVQVLAQDAGRSYALFTNDSDTAIYLNFSSASSTLVNYAVRLNAAGGSYEMSSAIGNLYSGEVWASSTVATKTLITLVK